ncbi:MAG: sugar ABC transporter ATP-binding protein [Actinobacteria bacterium]|nr:MAG: sugar ABC transporter ATP-binding protein [Actinomycetota bacterium]REK38259.1 MAG: sugar ABC transporter ATP-binding protein [Actinomycetota bacterium]
MSDKPLLQADGIAKRFGTVVALRSANLQVEPGEIHALLGANGAGKSTLVKALSGVHRPDAGSIRVNGELFDVRNPRIAAEAGLATVFQDPALIPDLTVEENLRLTNLPSEVVHDWLERMDLADVDFEAQIRDLPLPTLRLLDLARALARDPSLLMLDEITAALTADQAEHVFAVMEDRKSRGKSVLFITHRLGEVLRMCDRATVLRDGQDVEVCVPGEVGEAGLVQAMLGEVAKATPDESSALASLDEAPVALETIELRSGDEVRGVSFSLRAGEVLGVAALEDQGQDRLFELLSGDRRADAGEIILADGEALDARSPYDAVRKGVVLVPSDRLHALLPKRPIRENLTTPLYNKITKWFSLAGDEKQRVDSAIDRLSIDTRAGKQAGRLSGGNQQKVVVGRWLASGFRVLLCFDPTRGIDVGTKQQIYHLLRELADGGAAVLLYTSELAEIPLVCDRVLVLYDGEIVDEQPAVNATEQALLTAAHGISEEVA